MFKAAVLSLLVLGCSALPYQPAQLRYGGSGYGIGQSFLTSQPRISHFGLNSGYRAGGYGGISSGFLGSGSLGLGYGSGYGSGFSGYGGALRTGYSGALLSAPVTTQVVSAPVQTIGLGYSAAPAVQSYGYNSGINLLNVRQGQQFEQVVPAAIQQISRTVEYRPFANQEQPIQAQVVEVEPSDNPVHLHFKTRSSTLSTSQSHVAAPAQEVQTSAAQDEPQRLITEVQKPVIQEVREVISPFRQVTQEINPVVESLHTVVTKGEGHRQQYIGQQYAAPAIQTGLSYQQYAAPAIQTVAAPAYQTYSVQSAPSIAVETVSAPLVSSVGYQTALASPIATSTYSARPAYTSSFNIGTPSVAFQSKPLSSGYTSYSSSNY